MIKVYYNKNRIKMYTTCKLYNKVERKISDIREKSIWLPNRKT